MTIHPQQATTAATTASSDATDHTPGLTLIAILNNMATIAAMPFVARGRVAAGHYLLDLAADGADVYGYQAAGSGTWNIWLDGLRVTLDDYLRWHAATIATDAPTTRQDDQDEVRQA